MNTWIKFPASHFTEPSMMKLRRELGDAALALPARLWCFAANQDGTGLIAEYDAKELAEALGHKGDAKKMLRALKAAGYVGKDGTITDWEEIFGLCASRRQAGRTRALKRWGPKTVSPSAPPPAETSQAEIETNQAKPSVRGENQALPDAMPDASHTLSYWPEILPDEIVEKISEATFKPAEMVRAMWPAYRDKEAKFKADYSHPDALAGFRDDLRKAKAPKYTPTPGIEPPNWREDLEALYPGNLINARNDAWSTVPADKQAEVLRANEDKPSRSEFSGLF